MCVTCATADALDLVAEAKDVADVVLGRYLRADQANLYIVPVGLTRPTPPTVPGTVPDTATQK